VEDGVQLGPLGTAATDWPIVPAPGDYDDGEFGGIKIGRGNRPSATLSTTNPTWQDPGSDPGRRGEKPATNRLSYGAALFCLLLFIIILFIFILMDPTVRRPLCFTEQYLKKTRIIFGLIQQVLHVRKSELLIRPVNHLLLSEMRCMNWGCTAY
jgi:hypothetical protein